MIYVKYKQNKSAQQIESYSFLAPPLSRRGPLDVGELEYISKALGLEKDDVVAHSWCVNGPEWRGLMLKSAADVLAVVPNQALLGDKDVGIIGPNMNDSNEQGNDSSPDFEVRAFCPLDSPFEDPATGSLNAGLAQWLIEDGLAPKQGYTVKQGTAVGRSGLIVISGQIDCDNNLKVWVGGSCTTCINGTANFTR